MMNLKSSFLKYLWISVVSVMVIPQFVACSKEGTNAGTTNAYLNIINLSTDVQPFNLYAEFLRQGTTVYRYPNASGYFLQNVDNTPLQIRNANLNVTDTLNYALNQTLKRDVRYTWFITGFRADSSLTSIFTTDSSSAPASGRSKVRFVNASPGSSPLSLIANDTLAFKNLSYKGVTNYIDVTAGTYNFRIAATGNPSLALTTLRNYTVLDGKLYTIYAYGLQNRTDTAAFAANVVLNTIPDKK